MRGGFQGTWWTENGSVPVKPVLALVGAIALAAWLATVLWILAVIGFVILALIVTGIVLLRRGNPADAAALAEQAAALRAGMTARAVAHQQPLTVNHYNGGTHLHLPSGTGAGLLPTVLPVRDAITEEE